MQLITELHSICYFSELHSICLLFTELHSIWFLIELNYFHFLPIYSTIEIKLKHPISRIVIRVRAMLDDLLVNSVVELLLLMLLRLKMFGLLID